MALEAAWEKVIYDAIKTCAFFLLILSEKSVHSEPVWNEFKSAKGTKRPLIVVQSEAFRGEMPGQWSFVLPSKHRIDFVNQPYAKACETLVKTLGQAAGAPMERAEDLGEAIKARTLTSYALKIPSFDEFPSSPYRFILHDRWRIELAEGKKVMISTYVASKMGLPMVLTIRKDGTFEVQLRHPFQNTDPLFTETFSYEGTWSR